jgi:hypothetical protein
MKTLLIAVLLCAMAVWAQPDAKLVGTWTEDGQMSATWTFRPDGSGFREQTNPKTTARFTWDCRGASLQVNAGGLSVPYTVLSNDGNSLVIRNEQLATTYTLRKKA